MFADSCKYVFSLICILLFLSFHYSNCGRSFFLVFSFASKDEKMRYKKLRENRDIEKGMKKGKSEKLKRARKEWERKRKREREMFV